MLFNFIKTNLMKNILNVLLLLILLTATNLSAQVGIGITEPDASAMLDVGFQKRT
jgi:hypothetical protein